MNDDPTRFAATVTRRTALAGLAGLGLALATPVRQTVAQEATAVALPGELPPLLIAYYAGWTAHDDGSRLAALFTEDGVYEDVLAGVVVRGRTEIAAYVAGIFAGFPDLDYEVPSGFVAGDWAATEWVYVGTYTGTSPGLPPGTGQPVRLPGADILEVRGDKIARVRSYYDSNAFLAQLGMLSSPAGTPTG